MPQSLITDLWFSDPKAQFFAAALERLPAEDKDRGFYLQRLEAADIKLRHAARALLGIENILSALEHGEFIYFDDDSRLQSAFYLESMLIFLRASLDTAINAYSIALGRQNNLDSFNDFLRKVASRKLIWLPPHREPFWSDLARARAEADFTWLRALVGPDNGQSLRDLAVHRASLQVDTWINERDRGRFIMRLFGSEVGYAMPWLKTIFDESRAVLTTIRDDLST